MRVPSTRGVELQLHHLGGEGDVILVAHATGLCGRAYEGLARVLATELSVWAIDFRGHGDSTAPTDGDFVWHGMADDVLAAVDAVAPAGRVHGFGHSMGGAALLLAERVRPGLLRSAFLFEPVVSPTGRPLNVENRMSSAARRRRRTFPSKAEALLRYATTPALGLLRADGLAAYVEHGFRETPDGTVELKCDPEHEARTFEHSSTLPLDQAAEVDVPAVVAVGGREAHVGPGAMAAPVAEALRGRLITYPHLAHFGPLQDPETVGADVLALTRSV